MAHEFEVRDEVTVEATPEDVWTAITTGPAVDSWFMGRTEIEPREGGAARLAVAGFTIESTVSAWEPGKRYAFRGAETTGGTLHAFEYLIEARAGGSTVIRLVHSGFLGNDDWEAEYDAMGKGDRMYLRMLAAYLTHFRGRTAVCNLFLPGPHVPDRGRVWDAFTGAFGLAGPVTRGNPVRLAVDGLPVTEGVVEVAQQPDVLGARTGDGLYALVHDFMGMVVQYHGFAPDTDATAIERAWQGWLDRSFAA